MKLSKSSRPKLRVTLEQYAAAWDLLGERERLCVDLVMFAGMRESEAFALWCGDISGDGIQIAHSLVQGAVRASEDAEERTEGWSAGRDFDQAVQLDRALTGKRSQGLRFSVV